MSKQKFPGIHLAKVPHTGERADFFCHPALKGQIRVVITARDGKTIADLLEEDGSNPRTLVLELSRTSARGLEKDLHNFSGDTKDEKQ